jgi:hypothetical protein
MSSELGSNVCTVVDLSTTDREVKGPNPARENGAEKEDNQWADISYRFI